MAPQHDWIVVDDDVQSSFGDGSVHWSDTHSTLGWESMSIPSTQITASTVSRPDPLRLSLGEVCSYIDAHVSFQAAEIVSTECYVEWTGTVFHRFLILELRRPPRKNAWLRLDRRRRQNMTLFQFLASGGVTPANDQVNFGTDRFGSLSRSFYV